jgi:hypothetical protein
MPFGEKPDASGTVIDFDAVYEELIRPAVEAAGLEPLRADEERAGGVIHKPMFERLVLCDYAVADLTTANANVFYELGVRHAVRPHATVLVASKGSRLPFDLALDRTVQYSLDPGGRPNRPGGDRGALTAALETARERSTDSPVFQLLDGMRPQRIEHEKTDVFRERVRYSREVGERLAAARSFSEGSDGSDAAAEAVRAVEADLGPIEDVEAGILVDLLLSYRAVKDWQGMIDLAGRLPEPLGRTALIREQHAFALNRAGRGEEAERLLRALIDERGPSSETHGLLGRVYKDRWEAARKAGSDLRARGELKKAIDAYLRGFETDWRDAYPGINAVTLMEIADPPDPRRHEVLPVVRYAVERRIASGEPDYWDHATRLELAVLAADRDAALDALGAALAAVREPWEPETTARNLRLIREAREARNEDAAWIGEIETELEGAPGE